jgi:hypothetical protein
MDEIGRGTSTFDGLALAGAIASHLHDRNKSFTLFATHYFELTEFPKKHERALNLHVGAVESGHDIVFLHQIEPGPASRSYGVQVARLAGMPRGADPPGARHAGSAGSQAARRRPGPGRPVRRRAGTRASHRRAEPVGRWPPRNTACHTCNDRAEPGPLERAMAEIDPARQRWTRCTV